MPCFKWIRRMVPVVGLLCASIPMSSFAQPVSGDDSPGPRQATYSPVGLSPNDAIYCTFSANTIGAGNDLYIWANTACSKAMGQLKVTVYLQKGYTPRGLLVWGPDTFPA